MSSKLLYFLILIFSTQLMISQNEMNQLDENGKRHGVWKKFYDGTKQLRYEGTFDHGREIGVFKYYCGDCEDHPTVVKTFNENDLSAQVQFLTIKGKIVSEGKMINKNRVGEWVYYHKSSNKVMTKEFYKEGKLEGLKITYYTNDQITEKTEYKDGLKNGIDNYYSPEGVLLKKLIYKNDQLQGPAYYYDSNGNVIIEGNYKEGKKDGIWKYYNNGKLIKEETFPKPVRN